MNSADRFDSIDALLERLIVVTERQSRTVEQQSQSVAQQEQLADGRANL